MISPTKTAPTIVTNALPGESRQFTIKATGKAFRILIDGLYSRKEAAVVREIMSNAWDSHMAAGTPDVAIKVTCPTQMDPIFRVRDFGVSMPHDQVMDLYTRIFESTKEGTNDQLGQFGLGSKTPFAYTDSFTVTTWLNGEKRTYVAFINDDDVPVINHVGTEPQGDEPQGVEISVPVRPADLHTFKKEIAHMVMASDVLPILDGMSMPEDTFVHEGDGYRVVRDNYSMGLFAVRQGCVVYPTPTFSSPHVNYGYTLIVDVPIGSVDVTANREAMSLNDTTRQTVQRRLNEVNHQIEDYIEELNNSFPNRLAAFQAYASHEGWLRAQIGRRTVKLMPDHVKRLPAQIKTPALQLDCYYTKTKTRPQYEFTRTDNIHLLVDRGESMLRRNLRLGQYYEHHRHAMVAVVKKDDVARLVRVLGLKKDQVKTLQEIADVPVNHTARLGTAGKHAAPKTLPAGTFWLPKTGAKSVNMRIGDAWIGSADDITTHTWSATLKTLGFDASKVVFLTERQQEALKAPEAQRLDVAVVKAAEAYATKKKLKDHFTANADHTTLDTLNNYWQMEAMMSKELGGRFPHDMRNVVWGTYENVIKGLRPRSSVVRFTDVDQRVRDILKMSRSGTLTADTISAKVVSEIKPLIPLLKSKDPVAALVEFYLKHQ